MAQVTTHGTFLGLARDRGRLFAAPILFLLAASAAVAGGLLIGGLAGISLVALGGVAALAGSYLAALVSSYRLMVEPGALNLRWLGGERRYRLVRGPVTRVVVRGRGAAALHPRFGALGWAVGPAMLRGNESIELIRLSVRPALILVPTERGRLGIAPAVENELFAALTHAVRLQERLDQIASLRGLPATVPMLPAAVPMLTAAPAPAPTSAPAPAPAPAPPPAPRVLTGIERALIEQRLGAERAAALAAAHAGEVAPAPAAVPEPALASVAAAAPAEMSSVAVVAPSVTRRREPARGQRPAWLAVPGSSSVVEALLITLPLVGAGVAWIAVTVTGRPALPVDETRLLLVALALVGPVGAIAGLIARTWYPRLGALVVASSLAALAILARTILA